MADAAFAITGCRAIPLLNTSYSESSFSAGLIGFITAFVPGRRGVSADELAAWADDLAGPGRGYFFSLNRYLFIASKQAR
jgi:arsenite methyltransferase